MSAKLLISMMKLKLKHLRRIQENSNYQQFYVNFSYNIPWSSLTLFGQIQWYMQMKGVGSWHLRHFQFPLVRNCAYVFAAKAKWEAVFERKTYLGDWIRFFTTSFYVILLHYKPNHRPFASKIYGVINF